MERRVLRPRRPYQKAPVRSTRACSHDCATGISRGWMKQTGVRSLKGSARLAWLLPFLKSIGQVGYKEIRRFTCRSKQTITEKQSELGLQQGNGKCLVTHG